MCGIVGYLGPKPAAPLLVEGLKRLEYRGYDSAGVAVLTPENDLQISRSVGRVSVLEQVLAQNPDDSIGHLGIAHTRWATHGKVTEQNAHPHFWQASDDGPRIALVHNGTIENYATLRKYLANKGHTFYGESDTEILAKLIGEMYDGDLKQATQAALREVTGAYAIAVITDAEPNTMVCARKGGPLIIGLAQDAYVVASDQSAIVAHTTQVIHLDDYHIARLTSSPKDNTDPNSAWSAEFETTTIDNAPVTPKVRELELSLDEIELNGYPHYMLKEIMEQPESLNTCFKGRIDTRDNRIVLGGLTQLARDLVKARKFILTAQGTAYHAALVGEYLLEEFTRIPAECEYASEFRYRNPIIEDGTFVIVVSQSGETTDTLEALREARERGASALGVVNVVGSTMSHETDAGVYLRVGPEIGVASTKAFIGQVAVLAMISLFVGRRKLLSNDTMSHLLGQLDQVPNLIGQVLKQSDAIAKCVEKVIHRNNWLFLGRGFNFPVAMEGALKLKEISYIHAEGMPAAEMKHGPIALIDEGMPVVFLATRGSQYDKVCSNIEEVKARGGRVILVATEGDEHVSRYAEPGFTFYVPDIAEPLQPLLTTVPLQLLAYHAAVMRGQDVDKPRNLAKSVTVE